jgi:hypothetical protein
MAVLKSLMAANTAKVRVGRLLEIRAAAGYRTVQDVDQLFEAIGEQLRKLSGPVRHVTVVDWRCCPLMSPEAAQHIASRIGETNGSTERSAALAASDAPVAVLQFVRVIREAKLDDRKLFFEEQPLLDWLHDCLTSAEFARLKDFLAEGRALQPRRVVR